MPDILAKTVRLPLWAVLCVAIILGGVTVWLLMTQDRLGYPVDLKRGASYDVAQGRMTCTGGPADQDQGSVVFLRDLEYQPRLSRLPLNPSCRCYEMAAIFGAHMPDKLVITPDGYCRWLRDGEEMSLETFAQAEP